MFVVAPKQYHKHAAAFADGVWIQEDPRPWLGMAMTLSSTTTREMVDPFPVGEYSGGTLDVP